jgi:hypothetical protein
MDHKQQLQKKVALEHRRVSAQQLLMARQCQMSYDIKHISTIANEGVKRKDVQIPQCQRLLQRNLVALLLQGFIINSGRVISSCGLRHLSKRFKYASKNNLDSNQV